MNILNTIAASLLLVAALRALQLFHCHLGVAGRLALSALGFFAWAGVATGQLTDASGVSQGLLLSAGMLCAVLLWRTRSMAPACALPRVPREVIPTNRTSF